jgi:DNA-binding XRE family transcriptional regulator
MGFTSATFQLRHMVVAQRRLIGMSSASMGLVKTILQEAVMKAGNKKKLARIIGTRPQTITSWERGAWPSEKFFVALTKFAEQATSQNEKEVHNG